VTTTQLQLFTPPRPPIEPPRTTGFVYFGSDGCNIKIGYTTSLRRRGGELKLTMLWTVPGTVEDERAFHRTWARRRIGSSEWFRPDARLLEWLDERVLRGTAARAALRMLIFRRAASDV
jgi:hypothetical protein